MGGELDDAALVEAVRAGDSEAFGALVERHYDRVFGLCRRMSGNAFDAEDLAHDVLVEGFLKLDQLREPGRFAAWLRQVALNVCRMWHRRRRPTVPLDEETAAAGEPQPDDDDDDARVLARMSFGMSRLSPRHRIALVLHYLEGLSYRETAAFLDVPVGTVMSRLYRARRALKAEIESAGLDEELPVAPDPRFRSQVESEIALLLQAHGTGAGSAERLSVLLRRSPERFARLVEAGGDETTPEHLALLLPRLRAGAMEIALRIGLRGPLPARVRASEILRDVVARSRAVPASGPERVAPREVYCLLDRLFELRADPAAKAELLVELAGAAEDGPVRALLTNALLCYPEAAFDRLVERFLGASDPAELRERPHVLYALCRTGGRFAEILVEPLGGPDPGRQGVALAGVEALAACLEAGRAHRSAGRPGTTLQLLDRVRCAAELFPLSAEHVGCEILDRLADRVAALAGDPRADVREAAIRALADLRPQRQVERIREQLTHRDASTRRQAILALAQLGDVSAVPRLIHAARAGEPAERRAAVAALGRLGALRAEPALTGLLDDPDRRVQEAAAVALGELGTGSARATLDRLLGSPHTHLRKAAAKALFRTRGRPRDPSPTTRQRVRKIRGEARPHTYRSVDAAVRFALDELRPYEELDLTRRIARVCGDYSGARRLLIERGVMSRDRGTYALTGPGRAMWRVERFIRDRYLAGLAPRVGASKATA